LLPAGHPFAPYYQYFAKHEWIRLFVKGITAMVIGAIAGAAIILGRRAILPHAPQVDVPAAAIALGAFAVLLWVKKIPEPLVILVAGVVWQCALASNCKPSRFSTAANPACRAERSSSKHRRCKTGFSLGRPARFNKSSRAAIC
jgi:chromate transport protein ChrA